jgi:type I restriction enzyme S subunit
MTSKWTEVEVGYVCSVGDGAHSKVKRQTSGVLYLTSKNIGRGQLKLESFDFISNDDFEKLFPSNSKATRRPQAGDVLIGIIGTFGNAYVYKESDNFGFSSSIGILRPDPTKVISNYLYYVITSQKFRALHENHDGGSVQGYTNIPTIKKLKLPLPPVREQEKIADVLSILDDRIALLRETNATLEAIAQALFKSWFVDFDPVHAKQQGRAPEGMDEATAALFPDSLEESELGLVPKGWQVSQIDEISEKVGMGPFGSNIKVSTFVDEGVPVLNGKHVQHTLMEDLTFNFLSEAHAEKLKNSCVSAGDVVFTHRGTLGQVALVPDSSQYPKYMISQSQFFLRCDKSKMLPEWITYFFKSKNGQHLLLSNISQVGVPSIARPVSHLRSIKLALPPIDLLQRFSEITASLHKKVIENRNQTETLVNIRETLLPFLISGQLRLSETETAIVSK